MIADNEGRIGQNPGLPPSDTIEGVVEGEVDYDQAYQLGAHWETGELSQHLLPFIARLTGGKHVIDAGCGAGRDAIYLAGRGFRVTGVDMSPVGIALAKQRSEGTNGVDFVVGKLERLPFADGSFDAGYSTFVMEGKTFPEQVAELSRVIKPGGIMDITMFTQTKYEKPSERDSHMPLPFVTGAIESYFEIQEQTAETLHDTDDHGEHTHESLHLVLVNRGSAGDEEQQPRITAEPPNREIVSTGAQFSERARKLLSEPLVGVLSVLRPDGSMVQTEMWYELRDDGTILMNTTTFRHKYRYLKLNPSVSLIVSRGNSEFVTMSGTVTLDEDPETAQRDIRHIAQRYLRPVDLEEIMRDEFSREARVSIILRPTRIIDYFSK